MAARMLPVCSRAVHRAFESRLPVIASRKCSTNGPGAARSFWTRPVAVATGVVGVGLVTGAINWRLQAKSLTVESSNQAVAASQSGVITIKGEEVVPASWQNIGRLPDVPISRKVDGPNALPGIRLTLFQYQTCPFCCKVRAFLDFAGIPYDVVEVEPVLRQQIKFSQYKKVPILLLREGENCWQLNDSSVIVSILQSFLLDSKPGIRAYLDLYQPVKVKDAKGKEMLEVFNKYSIMRGSAPSSSQTVGSEIQWRKWADEHLVHILSPNVYRSWDEALQAFHYFSDVGDWERLFPAWERNLVIYVGATAMYFVGKRLQKKYNLMDDVRLSFYEACNTWTEHLGKSRFSGGDKPNLADLAVFGVLSSVEGCTAFGDVLKNTQIERWYNDMKMQVRKDGKKAIEA